MLRATIHKRPLSFTGVNNYTVYEDGQVHIGNTIRRFLRDNRITVTSFADEVGLTRGGLNHILAQRFISTDRLEIICKVTGYNFFQVFAEELDKSIGVNSARAFGEPGEVYPAAKPKRSRIILDLEDGEVVGTSKESESMKEIMEQQRKQWDALVAMIPDLAKKMKDDPSLNPGNMDVDDLADDFEEDLD